jgi:hypothetical protein
MKFEISNPAEKDEENFSSQVDLVSFFSFSQKYSWADKFKPRKP